jgi:hypothetical protein
MAQNEIQRAKEAGVCPISHGTLLACVFQAKTRPVWAISLPLSSTGLRAWVSVQTLETIHSIRSQGIPFVMISGARTSTIFQRIPFLPLADAVATENGGRLFHSDGQYHACCPLRENLVWRARHEAMTGVLCPLNPKTCTT